MDRQRNNNTATSVTRSQTFILVVTEMIEGHDTSHTDSSSYNKPGNGHERINNKDFTNFSNSVETLKPYDKGSA